MLTKAIISLLVMLVAMTPGYLLNRKYRRIQKYPTTEAKVLNVVRHNDMKGKLKFYAVTIEYTIGGRLYSYVKEWYFGRPLKTTLVYYNPEEPEKVYTEDDFKTSPAAYVLGGILGVVLIFTIFDIMNKLSA